MKHEFNKVERFNATDWSCFAGAKEFSDGSDPFIVFFESRDICWVTDASGSELFDANSAADGNYYQLRKGDRVLDRLTPEAIEAMLNGWLQYLLNAEDFWTALHNLGFVMI